MKKIAVFTSGGDAPGMNACIRAVVRATLNQGMQAVGIRRGYQGMIDADFWEMDGRSVSNIIHRGGTILGSARCKAFHTPEGRQQAYNNLIANGIDGVVAIGGDGTFTGARIFLEEYPDIAMVGCPGTIDNDLFGTDYTIGYDTAINTAMHAIDSIKDTASAHDRLFFIEVMGRDAGYIALYSGIATGAEEILIPETVTDLDTLIARLNSNFENKKNSSIVVVAEGDDAGGAFKIAELVKNHCRYEIKVSILGHLQRGGSPTCMERVRASRMGVAAVKALKEGQSNIMIGMVKGEIEYTPFEKAIKSHTPINPMLLEMVELLA
ncbi:MAG TPA: 6-phosphofructokinase [Saprospiraceae bacterium]|nr:6-phosphofructokinase [Saprospiraceae bacterium]HMQ85767.1 6-phosphofructokinase [Saprospiraceae bacterium]